VGRRRGAGGRREVAAAVEILPDQKSHRREFHPNLERMRLAPAALKYTVGLAQHLGLGDRVKALSLAEESIGVSRSRLEMSGAKSYESFLHVAPSWRGWSATARRERELRKAHRLFTETGAPIRAEEVAKELGTAVAT
jgi:hypothetical protein